MHGDKKVWLITGCSSGFGKLLAEKALARGDRVVITARKVEPLADLAGRYPDTALVCPLDVTDMSSIEAAISSIEAMFGHLDILVNNAGFGLVGAVEEVRPGEYRPLFDTNVFGLIDMTRAALPLLRRKGGGRIVNFSSVGGITGRQGFGLYNATKFAVEGLSEALAEEVEPFGIRVIIVEPGAFRTEFLGRSITSATVRLPEYESTSGTTRDFSAANNGTQAGDPVRGMDVVIAAILAPEPPLRLPLGKDAFQRIEHKFERLAGELEQWRPIAEQTGFG
jgi:NAD(P)-dependent dehydrogenase (short-subunit alcohol dehydrogenase family)